MCDAAHAMVKQSREQAAEQVAVQHWLDALTVAAPWSAMRAVYLDEVDSTNRYALTHGAGADGMPVLVWADRQTAGVGRQGRSWVHQPGSSLAFSLGLPYAPPSWEGLSLVVGLAVAQALHPQVQLKWPNDLWWQQRKLGGILIQTSGLTPPFAGTEAGRYAVIGVGLNLHPITLPPTDNAGNIRQEPVAACSAFLLPDEVNQRSVLMRVVPVILSHLVRFQQQGFAAFRHAYSAVDGLCGMQVQTSDGLLATARGVSSAGGLLLQAADGELHTYTGLEVSIRPIRHAAADDGGAESSMADESRGSV